MSFSRSGHSEVANVSAEKTYEPGSTGSIIDCFLAANISRERLMIGEVFLLCNSQQINEMREK